MGTCGTTAPPHGTTAGAYGTTALLGAVLPRPNSAARTREARKRRKLQGKRKGQEGDVYVMIPPKPFRRRPPLNSTAFLRLKSTKKKRRKTPSSIVFEGQQTVLCLAMKCPGNSRHTISPQKHCHQSPKHLRDKYALTERRYNYLIKFYIPPTHSFREKLLL